MMRTTLCAAIMAATLAGGCGNGTTPAPDAERPTSVAKADLPADATTGFVRDERFVDRLAAIAREFTKYDRLGDAPKWAPTSCIGPPPPGPLLSESVHAGSHGRKLYYLYSRDSAAYLAEPRGVQPVGQTLVKRSYAAEPIGDDPTAYGQAWRQGKATERHGTRYRLGAERELFVMLKLDPTTAGTDLGWVYATITPDGSRVTAAGRIAECMRCHVTADNDRIFGASANGDVSTHSLPVTRAASKSR